MSLLYSRPLWNIRVEKKPSQEVVELLEATLWGTKGPIYQHKNTRSKVSQLQHPLFFSLVKDKETVGNCTFSKRLVMAEGRSYQGYYSCNFSIEKKSQGKIFAHLLLKTIKNYFEQTTSEPSVFYGYVDEANIRSARLLHHLGLKKLRTLETISFSRIFPKADSRVSKIPEHEKSEVLALLKEQYKDYVLVNFDRLFSDNQYFVFKKNNQVVAGVHAIPAQWRVVALSGLSGKIIMSVVPHIPLVSRLFNPKNFHFAAFEGIYCRPGFEKEFFILLESVCALLKENTGMVWLDSKSDLYVRLNKIGHWGIINRLQESLPAHVVAAFKNLSEDEQKIFEDQPVYASAFDIV